MITTPLRRHDLVGNATAGPFPYQFLITSKNHLQVWVDGNLKTVDTHYTVAGVGSESGGTVTFTTGNEPSANAEIQFLGNEPATQATDYINAGNFPAASHEAALDKLTILVAQIIERLGRVPTLSLANHYNKSDLSIADLVAGQFARANPTADGLEFAVPTTVPSGLPVGGNYDHLTINGSGIVEWAQQIYNFSPGWVNISRYGNNLATAVTAIGAVTPVTLVVSTLITVAGNVTVTANISLFFTGAGGLTIANGITVGYNGGSFAVDDIRRQRFFGLGEFNGSNLSEVIPDQWGADATGVLDSAVAIRTAIRSLHATLGGTLRVLPGAYSHATEITIDRPVVVLGSGIDITILQLSANASLRCGLKSVTNGFAVKNITIKTVTPPVTNLEMSGIRCDLFGTAVPVGQQFHVENVKVRGYNIGIFADGDNARRITNVTEKNVDVQCSGPAADYIGSCLHVHRCLKVAIEVFDLDKNATGEHGMYFSEIENLRIKGGKIRNATRGGAWGIKMVTDVAGMNQSVWTFEDIDIEDCTSGIQCSPFQNNIVDNISLSDIRLKDLGLVSGQEGAICFDLSNSSLIRNISLKHLTMNNLQGRGVAFQGAAGTEITVATIDGVQAFNWGTATPGAYALVGSTTTTLTLRLLSLANIYANGNTTNGRCIVDSGSLQSSVKRAKFYNLKQELTVLVPPVGFPINFTDLDTTPSVALGNVFYVNNTGATSITRLDDMLPGEEYTLIFANGNTTLVDGATLANLGSVPITPGSTDVYGYTTFDGTLAVMALGNNN